MIALGARPMSIGPSRPRAAHSRPSRAPRARSAWRCSSAIIAVYERRLDEWPRRSSEEMGAPLVARQGAQAPSGLGHFKAGARGPEGLRVLEKQQGTTRIVREPVGVCGLITPWNWPMNQIACKVAPALAAGCTMVLKPSEIAPLSAARLRGDPARGRRAAGVFNLVNGDGPTVGAAIVRRTRASTWCRSPARPAPASRSPRPRPTRSSASRRSSAASRRTSSSTTPTSSSAVDGRRAGAA